MFCIRIRMDRFSPLYNQVVEFNPLKPHEIIGDLAQRWDVTADGLTVRSCFVMTSLTGVSLEDLPSKITFRV